jgi:phenylacetate-coenzyme A ligase PaaK-like adenylate-forming protein
MGVARTLQDRFSKHITPRFLKLYQLLRPARRRSAVFFKEGLQFRTSTDNWDNGQKQRWILERLRYVLRHATQTTLYYAELFKRVRFDPKADFDFSDFAKLPPLDRGVILKSGQTLIAGDISKPYLQKDASGGSSGQPVRIWIGPAEMGWHLSAHRFFMDKLGVLPGSRVAYLWGHHLDPAHKPSLARRAVFYARNERWFDCFRLSGEVLLEYHREMERFQPDCMVAYASALAAFATFLKERGILPVYPLRCILTGAEKLFPFQREVAEEVFRCPVYERYGSRDGGVMGYQLPPSHTKDFVIDWSNVLVEPETTDKESPILITKLHADGMPMIRYRVDDVGLFPEGSQPGYPVLSLRAVIGRTVDNVWLPNGTFINGIQFPHLFKDFPVREFMVIQSEDYSLEVQIIPAAGFDDRDRDSIRRTIEKNLPGLPIQIMMVESIQRTIANKWRPVLSRVSR